MTDSNPDLGEDLRCELPLSAHQGCSGMLPVSRAQRLAEFLSILADPNRLRIISLLTEGERCVGDIAAAVAMSESAVSHQLRVLRANRLVDYRRQGRHIFYRLDDDHILTFYQALADHINHIEPE